MSSELDIQIDRGDAPLIPYLDQYALPERFIATVTPPEPDLPICHLIVTVEGGRPICEELHLERKPGGPPLGGAALRRIPVADYVRRAVDRAGHWRMPGSGPLTFTADGETTPLASEPAGEGHVATPLIGLTATKEYKAASRAPREAGAVSDETLREVADTYRMAHARGEAPTKAVTERWYVSRSTASRWVKRARQARFLGPAIPREAGERPA